MNYSPQNSVSPSQKALAILFLCALASTLGSCSTAATSEGMVSTSFEILHAHPQTVRVQVTGGQESAPIGRPQITDADFTQALVTSIIKTRTFAKAVTDQNSSADYLITVTIFSLDKRLFRDDAVRMEAGWILRRATTGTIVWRESIISESTHSNFQRATEGAARNNIAQALAKISKLDL
jgi:hypothetical protein